MATKITDRAAKIAAGTITANGCAYEVWADTQVGQRVGASYGTRWWLLLTTKDGKTVNQSTMQQARYAEWMDLISKNGSPA